jgi:preprotein translocase subunit YajC
MNPGAANLLLIVLMFGAFYFLVIRPQRKRLEAQRQMQASIMPGDEVVTVGGLVVTVVSLDDELATVELSRGVTARIQRRSIAGKTQPELDAGPGADTDDSDQELEKP